MFVALRLFEVSCWLLSHSRWFAGQNICWGTWLSVCSANFKKKTQSLDAFQKSLLKRFCGWLIGKTSLFFKIKYIVTFSWRISYFRPLTLPGMYWKAFKSTIDIFGSFWSFGSFLDPLSSNDVFVVKLRFLTGWKSAACKTQYICQNLRFPRNSLQVPAISSFVWYPKPLNTFALNVYKSLMSKSKLEFLSLFLNLLKH